MNQANKYANTSNWQYERGKSLLELARPTAGEVVVDLGCGTGNLTGELLQLVGPTGHVIGADPDRDRLQIACQSLEASNVEFVEAKAEALTSVPDDAVDLVFSNYVLHWVPDKRPMLAEVARCLKPGGRLVFECCGELMPFLKEVSLMAGPEGRRLVDLFYCHAVEEWRRLFEQQGFGVEQIDWPELGFEYPNLDAFYEWWEGTSAGVFKRSNLSSDDFDSLKRRFPNDVIFGGNALRAAAILLE